MSHNKDYIKELNGKPQRIVKDRKCPDCNSKLGLLPPDRIWCVNSECNYGEMHLIGNGVNNIDHITLHTSPK